MRDKETKNSSWIMMDFGWHSKFDSVVIEAPVWCDHGLVRAEVV